MQFYNILGLLTIDNILTFRMAIFIHHITNNKNKVPGIFLDILKPASSQHSRI
jgi:hypothetical protein